MTRRARLVVWGGRAGDRYVGSPEDRTHVLYQNMLAAHFRGSRALSLALRQTFRHVGVSAQEVAERLRQFNVALERSVPSAAEQIEQAARSAGLLRGARDGRTDA